MRNNLLLFQLLFSDKDFGVGSLSYNSNKKELLIVAKDYNEAIEKGNKSIDSFISQEMDKEDVPVLTYDGSINPAFFQDKKGDPKKLKLIDIKLISSDLII